MDRVANKVELSDDMKGYLLSLCQDIDREDEEAYNEIVRLCTELELYWRGNTFLFWDGVNYLTPRQLNEPDYEDFERIVNIYKAHGEAVIAALAMEVPNTGFYPADANNPDDITTAHAYTKLSRIVANENRAPLLIIKALSILFNGGLIAGYNYHERNEKYGFIEVEEVETQRVPLTIITCPLCGVELQTPEPQMCSGCNQPIMPSVNETEIEQPLREETKQYPRGKEKLKLYGPPFVKIPIHIQSQDEAGYLRLSYEISLGLARSLYKKNIKKGESTDDFAREQRISLLYGGHEPSNIVTVKLYWIRPWYFYNIETEDIATQLERKFKNGCFCIVIGNELVGIYEENLDEHWTLSENPLYTYIFADPVGKVLKPVQDKRNFEDKLVEETLEHGVPFTIADSEALDWEKFRKTNAKPGDIIPGKAAFGKALQDGFHTLKTATFPQEMTQVSKRTDEAGQFVVGSYPSIYGGPSQGGSRTYAEYAASRSQALQRLSILWKIVVDWWTRMMERAVSSRAHNFDDEETFTEKSGDDFVTIAVKKAELNGKIGRVVSESSERLPLSWLQKKDQIMELMQLQSPEINSVLFHPENVNLLAMLFGFPELFIPGSDQRQKQLSEIKELAQAEPVSMGIPVEEGMEPQMSSSVAIEPDVDEHQIHSLTCASYLVSDAGQLLRRENPGGYQNIVMHKKEHDMFLQQQMMQQQMMQQKQAQNPPENKGGD
jgi:hypothetical protein